jgi:hypothetical protein
VRVYAIRSLSSLSEDERRLLTDILGRHPELAGRDLCVYDVAGGEVAGLPGEVAESKVQERSIVAPMSTQIGIGMNVICGGFNTAAQSVTVGDNGTRTTELQVAGEMLPADDEC